MFKFLRKLFKKISSTEEIKQTPIKRPPSIKVITRPSVPKTTNNKVVDHITGQFSWSKRNNVQYRVQYMTPEEIEWTLKANARQIQNKAKLPGDRIDEDGELLNPWWYK